MTKQKIEIFQELIKRQPDFLQRPIEELLPMRFLGDVAVKAFKGLIKNLDDLPLAQEEKEAMLKDGQSAGVALLMIEARIGQIYKDAPGAPTHPSGMRLDKRQPKTKKELAQQMPGTAKTEARKLQRAAEIASDPEAVAEVIKEAEENEDIPTKTAVLNKIAYKKEIERQKGKAEKSKLEMRGDAYKYFRKLEDAFRLIPTAPPKDLMERDYMAIKTIALGILKKLEAFINEQKSQKEKSLSK